MDIPKIGYIWLGILRFFARNEDGEGGQLTNERVGLIRGIHYFPMILSFFSHTSCNLLLEETHTMGVILQEVASSVWHGFRDRNNRFSNARQNI